MQLLADLSDGPGDVVAFSAQNADFDGPSASALDLAAHSRHEHGPSADGFAVVLLVIEAQIEVSTVVKQGDVVGHDPARCEPTRNEAIPAPLVFV
jgi:hypothetical protein